MVGEMFYGDGDMEVMAAQQDVYRHALQTIVSGCQDHIRRATQLLLTSTPASAAFLSITQFDHRTLQDAHDILAAAWRFEAKVNDEPDLFAAVEDRVPRATMEWLSWLRDEIERWSDSPALVRAVAEILTHQNTDTGYWHEDMLHIALFDRFFTVPWTARTRRSMERLRSSGRTGLPSGLQSLGDVARQSDVQDSASNEEAHEPHELEDDGEPPICICPTVGRPPCGMIPCITMCEKAEREGWGKLE